MKPSLEAVRVIGEGHFYTHFAVKMSAGNFPATMTYDCERLMSKAEHNMYIKEVLRSQNLKRKKPSTNMLFAHITVTSTVMGLMAHAVWSASVPCDVKTFDKASEDIIFLASRPHFPATKEELDKFCPKTMQSLQTATTYVENCTTGLAKGMMKLLMEGAGKEINSKCTEGNEGRESYLKVSQCIIPKAGQAIHNCNKKIAAIFEAAIAKPKKDRIPLSCCFMGEFYECVRKASQVCGDDAVAVTKQIIDSYAGDLMDSVCVTWRPGSAKCKTLPKLKPVSKPTFLTLAPSLAEVLSSLSN